MPAFERDAETLPPSTISLRTVVEVSAAFVALFAATSYALGLVGLWLQVAIQRTSGLEGVTTAWYAVSLAPRTVVAGQGALNLLVPLVRTLSVTVAVAVFLLVLRAAIPALGRSFGRPGSRLLAASGLEKQMVSFVRRPGPKGFARRLEYFAVSYLEHREPRRPFLAVLGATFVAYFALFVCFAVLVLAAIDRAPGALDLLKGLAPWVENVSIPLVVAALILLAIPLDKRGYALRRVDRRGLIITIVVAYVGAALLAFVQAAAIEPPLPEAELARGTDGELLGHADGYWYVLGTDGVVSAVLNEEAGEVRILTQR